MHYGDSIKISGYPAGRRLFELLKPERYFELEQRALQFFSLEKILDEASCNVDFFGLKLRKYPVAEISSEQLESKIDSIVQCLKSQNVKIRQRCVVNNIERSQACDAFIVTGFERNRYFCSEADVIVLATGRAGFASTELMIGKLGVEKEAPNISIGIRIEMPSKYLSRPYKAHKDFKFSEVFGMFKVKSFCFSNFEDAGGRLKYCYYHDQFDRNVVMLDGHANFSKNGNNLSRIETGNFALLVQLPRHFDLKWLNAVFIESYYNLFGGKPIFSSLSSFLEQEGEIGSVRPSVNDCARAAASQLFDPDVLNSLRAACKKAVESIAEANAVPVADIVNSSVVVAPEVEFFWPRVVVGDTFETSVPNLYIVGDAAGVAQGNLQACVAGLAAADSINSNN
ncbi:putative FAD-dependent dehydrogenase [Rhodoblastus acidophilus]|uniref:hypothetical protein n=1 Tax=Rhodoblastus acidophilus TaxID=1074 RepID=UPI0022251EDE|nr:hypothetical protein [Rhodoblastus acidophilus]MCW2286679.1 putative FAD-dependent dehydrogenase [Rhodoblastus acidophilus]MCW2335499.1 putative FAD-dependent dehydrogenase [Rhodoblastus acidophilus]